MAEPSNFAFIAPEYCDNNSSHYEKWDNAATPPGTMSSTIPSLAQLQATSNQGSTPQNENPLQLSLLTPSDLNIDQGGTDWSTSMAEHSRPISTPSVATTESQTSSGTYYGNSTTSDSSTPVQNTTWYDAAIDAGTGRHAYDHGNFGQPHGYPMIGSGKGVTCRTYFSAPKPFPAAATMDIPFPYPFQQNSIMPYQQPPFPNNFATFMQPIQSIRFRQMGSFQAGSIYGHPVPKMPTQSAVPDYCRGLIPMGQRLTPLRSQVPVGQYEVIRSQVPFGQHESIRPHCHSGQQDTTPVNKIAFGQQAVLKTTRNLQIPSNTVRNDVGEPKPVEKFVCYTCGCQYANAKAFHKHWLNTHVLPQVSAKKSYTKGKIMVGPTCRTVPMQQQQKQHVSASTALMPTTLQSNAGKPAGGPSVSGYILGDGNLSLSGLIQTDTPLDLSLKSGRNAGVNQVNSASSSQTLHPGGPQSASTHGSSITMESRTIETRPYTAADYLSIRSSDMALSFLLPHGALPNQMKHQSQSDDTDPETPSKKRVPPSEKQYPCPECPKGYSHRRGLQKHKKACHSTTAPKSTKVSVFEDVALMEQLPYPCQLCTKRFSSEMLLNQHLSFHARATP